MTQRDTMQTTFVAAAGWEGAQTVTIAGDASNRRYARLTKPDGATAVLMDAPPDKGEDVRPFVTVAQYLSAQGLSAPKIYAQNPADGFLLIEDLGDDLFARLMVKNPKRQRELYTAAVDALADLHAAPLPDLPLCDADWLARMTDTAFDWYAPDGQGKLAEFTALFHPMARALDATPKVVILRDFHAENLLWLPTRSGTARVGLLDFQDALLGHPAYDLVSILQDARRDVDPATESEMIAHYLTQTRTENEPFRTAYAVLGAQRNLRILGIFARLCLRDGKAHYVDMIPRVWGYVMRNLSHPALSDLSTFVQDTLPAPTPEFLEHLKSRCARQPSP